MAYKIVGNIVYHQVDGEYKIKQVCTSPENARKAVEKLIELGYTGNESRRKSFGRNRDRIGKIRR